MRVLFTGQSGVKHDTVRSNFVDEIINRSEHRQKDIISIDIGNIITDQLNINWWPFLESNDVEWQNNVFQKAIECALNRINSERPEIVLLSIHLCMLRKSRFFTPSSWQLLEQFSPDFAVTLIDDIYTIYSRIISREQSYRPTGTYLRLRELLTWRSIEILMTDRLIEYINSHKESGSPRVDNFVLSVKHPSHMLYKLIFKSDVPVIYAGSALSEPRKSDEGIEQVNIYRKRLHEEFATFDPSTIDEGILNWKFYKDDGSLKEDISDSDTVRISRNDRWPLEFEGYTPLCDDRDEYPIELKTEEIKEIATASPQQELSDIENQIRIRDFRLIDQSETMAGYRPYFNGVQSTGLTAELNYVANNAHITPFVVHNEQEDGIWGGHPFNVSAILCEDIDDLIDKIDDAV